MGVLARAVNVRPAAAPPAAELVKTLLTSGTNDPVSASIAPGTNCFLVYLIGLQPSNGVNPVTSSTLTSSGSGPTWTRRAEAGAAVAFDVSVAVFTAEITGSDPGSFTVTFATGNAATIDQMGHAIFKFTGHDTTTPFAGAAALNNNLVGQGPTTLTLGAIPTADDYTVALSWADMDSPGGATFDASSSGTWTTDRNFGVGGDQSFGGGAVGSRTGYSADADVDFSDVNTDGGDYGSAQVGIIIKVAGSAPAGITFREGVAIAVEGADPETVDPTADPVTGDILVLVVGQSNSAGFPNQTTVSTNGMGGTWVLEQSSLWGSRRRIDVLINDDFSTPNGTIAVDYGNNQTAIRTLVIVEGAASYTEVEEEQDDLGGATEWDINVGTSHDAYLAIVQYENNESVFTTATGWSELVQLGESGGVRRLALFVGDPSVGGFDSTPRIDWISPGSFTGVAFGFTAA